MFDLICLKIFQNKLFIWFRSRRLRKIEHFAQHSIVGGKIQTYLLVIYLSSCRRHVSLDFRLPPLPRAKLGSWPREDGRSFPHPNIITPNHTIRASCHLRSTHCVGHCAYTASFHAPSSLDRECCYCSHFTAEKAETEGREVSFPRSHTWQHSQDSYLESFIGSQNQFILALCRDPKRAGKFAKI